VFNKEEKQNTPLKISLSPFFPRTLAPVGLQYTSWFSDDILCMGWEGLAAGNDEGPHYYKLTIPGGKSGISPDAGIYMKEDISFLLEAVK
jgi:hypothetical protein